MTVGTSPGDAKLLQEEPFGCGFCLGQSFNQGRYIWNNNVAWIDILNPQTLPILSDEGTL
jgi:hypothetical protein